jgi:ABC-type Fe3+-hydroxamate transport system substrate-binding protein
MGSTEYEIKKFFLQYKEIPAVKNNKIFVVPSNILCQPTIKNFYIAVKEICEKLNE